MAKALFSRFGSVLKSGSATSKEERVRHTRVIARAIHALPDSAVLPYFDILSSAANNPELRRPAADAIKKLSAFGDQAVPTLIGMIDSIAPLRERKSGVAFEDWQEPYLAAMIAFCRAGPRARTALPLLQQRMQSKTNSIFSSYEKLVKNTLSRIAKDQPDTPEITARVSNIFGPCSF